MHTTDHISVEQKTDTAKHFLFNNVFILESKVHPVGQFGIESHINIRDFLERNSAGFITHKQRKYQPCHETTDVSHVCHTTCGG
ncbi:MAG: hypothetical protein ACD_34C00417G0001 [uncultured bacterium]|nr:MAG: hypothetical protein ACD_34C00417G0001 [uncultured bacterium]